MQDSKRVEDEVAVRKSEATSDETLSDVEETENDASAGDSGRDPGPSPDGRLGEPEEMRDAGPM